MQQSYDWTAAIARWRSSGKSKKAFCEREGISYWTFRDKLKQENPEFVRIMQPAVHQTPCGTIDLVFHEKLSIRLQTGYSRELLKMILEDLRIPL